MRSSSTCCRLPLVGAIALFAPNYGNGGTRVVGVDPNRAAVWSRHVKFIGAYIMGLAPFAMAAAWRTFVHARRWLERGLRGAQGILEGAACGFAGAVLVLLPGIVTHPTQAPPYLLAVRRAGGRRGSRRWRRALDRRVADAEAVRSSGVDASRIRSSLSNAVGAVPLRIALPVSSQVRTGGLASRNTLWPKCTRIIPSRCWCVAQRGQFLSSTVRYGMVTR